MLTLRQIEVFRAVIIAGSVTGAARMLYVSQPAVSRILSDLESEVGFKLFLRTNRQITPTAEGRLLYEEVEKSFVGLDAIAKSAEAIREYQKGELRIISIPSLAATLVPKLIATFADANPNLGISLEVQSTERIADWISSGQCDLGFTIPPVDTPSVEVVTIAHTEALCILPKSHPLRKKSVVEAEDIQGERFISFKSASLARHLIDDVFAKADCQRIMHIEARSPETICGLVAAGLGVSVIGPLFDYEHIDYNVIVRPFRPAIPIQLLLVTPANRSLSRIGELFVEAARENLKP